MEEAIQNGLPPEEIATQVFAAIRERRFYILTHPPFQKLVQRRMTAILAGANPDDARFA